MGMTMLYAIRDQETGSWVAYVDGAVYFRYMPDSCFDNYFDAADALKKVEDLLDQKTFKIVSFRELPAEACGWCGDITTEGKLSRMTQEIKIEGDHVQCFQIFKHTLELHDWKLCPNCGRALK